MTKWLGGVCIALLVAFLAAGWYLGRIESELIELRSQLAALENELAVRDTEVLSITQEFEEKLAWAQRESGETEPRHFNSLEELETWLAKDETDQMLYSRDKFNCIDFALMLQARALEYGYILSTEVLPIGAHWVNIAVIGDTIYVIEPQDDRIIYERE